MPPLVTDLFGGDGGHGGQNPPPAPPKPASYSWYKIDLANRSVLDGAKREEVRKMLLWLAGTLDRPDYNPQLVTLKFEMMAGSDEGLKTTLKERGENWGAKTDVVPE